ncbi:hypothetical protein [Blastomonas sp.]|uniref:hypothetical protein n=1 Tax=Blastomonas sp. TaxID=1909299 RepID=UPI00406A64CD
MDDATNSQAHLRPIPDELLGLVRDWQRKDAEHRAKLTDMIDAANERALSLPPPMIVTLAFPEQLRRMAIAAAVIAALNLPGAAMALTEALRQQPTILDLVSMAAFTAAASIAVAAWALLIVQQRAAARAEKLARLARSEQYRQGVSAMSAQIDHAIGTAKFTARQDPPAQADVSSQPQAACHPPRSEDSAEDEAAKGVPFPPQPGAAPSA